MGAPADLQPAALIRLAGKRSRRLQPKLSSWVGRGKAAMSSHRTALHLLQKGLPPKGCLSSLPTLCWGHGGVLGATNLLVLLQLHLLSLAPACPCQKSPPSWLVLLTSYSKLVGERSSRWGMSSATHLPSCKHCDPPKEWGKWRQKVTPSNGMRKAVPLWLANSV